MTAAPRVPRTIATFRRAPDGRRRLVVAAGAAASLAGLAVPARIAAQGSWRPTRPIVIYNPFAAGGGTDLHMRYLAEKAGRKLGQQVVVEVKAGAAGTLAPAHLLSARPDGHTLACMSINSLRYPHYQSVPWHPLRDFTYICGLSAYVFGIAVRTDAPWPSIEDLIAAGRREPEKFTYGTSGVGGSGHLMMIELEQTTGARFTHVPFKGAAEWMTALLAGHIHFLADAAAWAVHVDEGKCRLLAMPNEKPHPKYPQAPTLRSRGIDVVAQSVYGLVGPRGMPDDAVAVLYQAFDEVATDAGLLELLGRSLQEPWRASPAQYRDYAERYFASVRPVLLKAGLAKD